MVPLASAPLIGAFARQYREQGALPGEAASTTSDPAPMLVWPEDALSNLIALVLLGALLLLWWRHLRVEAGDSESQGR